jgi:hypothetical protein
MFKTVQEGVEVYLAELRKYIARIQELKTAYGHDNFFHWAQQDYEYVREQSACFKAMEQVLGISKEEADTYLVQVEAEVQTDMPQPAGCTNNQQPA